MGESNALSQSTTMTGSTTTLESIRVPPPSNAPQSSSSPKKPIELPDHLNPVKFTKWKKWNVVFVGAWFTGCSAMGSSLPSGAVDWIADYFSVENRTQLVLLNSLFLVGYSIGPLFFGPMSEYAGRSRVLLVAYVVAALFTMACALSPTFPALLVFRLLSGLVAAAPNAIVGGLYADIYDDPVHRGRVLAYFMAATTIAPPLGPIISGFSAVVSWRLTFWIGLGLIGVGLPAVVLLPETYVPVIRRRLRQRQARRIKAEGPADMVDMPVLSKTETISGNLQTIFARPFIMMVREPVVLFTSLYLALVYSILYLFFQAYPIIFADVYGLSPGEVGLCFLPVAGGAFIALGIFLWWGSYHSKALKADKPWASQDEYRRLPLACLGGPALSVSLFWLGWSTKPSISFVVPMLSGFLFGTGYLLIFMAMLNYLTDAYRQFSASAQSAASTTRSICAVCLPLATRTMYGNLGIAWACSLLGFLAAIMSVIPFVFIKYSSAIQERSPFCQQLIRDLDAPGQDEPEGEELRRQGTLNA